MSLSSDEPRELAGLKLWWVYNSEAIYNLV
jgi:hypothetical protein